MQVNLNSSVSSITSRYVSAGNRPAPAPADQASFGGSAALEESLRRSPEVRPEVVARARELAADVSYPPQETIVKIATLLAVELSKNDGL